MFRLEKEMIPVLKEALSQRYNTNYFVEEFPSGMGIADLVFSPEIFLRQMVLVDFESVYYITKFFNRKNKTVSYENLIKNSLINRNKIIVTIAFLKNINIISEREKGHFFINDIFSPPVKEFYSIEAKLKDWKNGLSQALRYKNYSHKTFLAISEEYLHRVDQDLLMEKNVGLISVNPIATRIIFQPKKQAPLNKIAYHYLSESFISRINNSLTLGLHN